MASIDRRPNGSYRARWRTEPARPQRVRHFAKKVDAQRFLDGVSGDLLRGLYIDPSGARTKFETYAEDWRRAQMHRPPAVTGDA